LPDFFRHYPDIAVALHLSDEKIDLISDGLDAAFRIAMLEDSSLVAKRLAPVRRFIVAAPSYIARDGRPRQPDNLTAHSCLGYAYRATRDVWHTRHQEFPGRQLTGSFVAAYMKPVYKLIFRLICPNAAAAGAQPSSVTTDMDAPQKVTGGKDGRFRCTRCFQVLTT
jgi:DNA-binding transcriptional LysR family regulator